MSYSISFSKKAIKELYKIKDPYYTAIKTAIIELENNPRPQGYKKLKGREAYRIRVSDYRVIYEIFDAKLIIEVINLGHRKNIYK